MQTKSKRKSRNKTKRKTLRALGNALHQLQRWCNPLNEAIWQKVSFDDPQNGGHFSCRKPVSHVGTSTVSGSEALIHLAYVQPYVQSKFVVILEGLTRWNWIVLKDATSWEWLQMHFDMHVCLLEKVLLCSFDSKNFCKFCTIFGPQNGGWKMDPKMAPEFDPQKWGRKMAPKRGANILLVSQKNLQEIKTLFKILGPSFWVPFLDPILGVKFWHHFWVHFSTSILGSKNGANFCKRFCCQSCIAKLFPANKHAYQNASVVISQLIASFNTIQSSTWSNLPK